MLSIFFSGMDVKTTRDQAQRAAWIWLGWFSSLTALAALLGLVMWRLGPNPALIGWLLYICGAVAILYRPRYGLYLILFYSLVGDGFLSPWYPFVKNFSSGESLFYLNNSLIISPMEVYLLLTSATWLGKGGMRRKLEFYSGALFWPAMAFTAFIIFGLLYGLGTGGSLKIGLWEARAIFYLPLMLVLASNLLTERKHISRTLWIIMAAIFIKAVIGDLYFFIHLKGDLAQVNAITEHAAAIHMNTLFVFVLAAWLYKASPAKRILLPLMVPVVGIAYIATQRRAAFLSLAIALVLIVLVLYKENRRLFWMLVPAAALAGLFYLAVFWNSASPLAEPAQAIKSVVAQNQATMEDQLSNMYRILENVNSSFTIHAVPLTGVGFGKKFFIIVQMPDISFFEWWEYITHNSIIWIWMKTGAGGFLSMIFLVGLSILVGVRALWRMPGGDLSAIALTALLYIIMHFIYAYVDMSWDIQSMVYVGTAMGILNSLEKIVSQSVPVKPRRWPWQPIPAPAPGLLPLSGAPNR